LSSAPPFPPGYGLPGSPSSGNPWQHDWRERLRLAYEGVGSLLTAEILYFIDSIIAAAILIVYVVTDLSISSFRSLNDIERMVDTYAAASMVSIIASIIMIVLGIIALVLTWQGFSKLTRYDKARYNIGFLGVMLEVAALAAAVLGAIMLIVAAAVLSSTESGFESFLVLLVLYMLVVVGLYVAGGIALAVGFWRIGDEWNSGIIKAGIILVLIGIIVPGLDIIGFILLLLGLSDVKKKIKAMLEGRLNPWQQPGGSWWQPYGR